MTCRHVFFRLKPHCPTEYHRACIYDLMSLTLRDLVLKSRLHACMYNVGTINYQ